MENRHLWLRSTRQHAIARVRHTVVKAVRDYLDDQGFILADTPIFTPAACEGTTTLFGVPYFDEGTAYLTQSGQLYNEATAAATARSTASGRPSARRSRRRGATSPSSGWWSRRSPSRTSTTRWRSPRGWSATVVAQALEKRKEELKVLERDTAKLETVKAPFPRLHYKDAMTLLHAKGSLTPMGSDFGGTDETTIAGEYDRPVVVHRFPSAIKAFYMAPDPEEPEYSLSADILAPEGYGEIVGGGERLADHELLLEAHPRAQPARGGVPLVPRPAEVRQLPPRGLRDGDRARRHLDLRHRPPARDDRLPPDAVPDLSLMWGVLRRTPHAPRSLRGSESRCARSPLLEAAATSPRHAPRSLRGSESRCARNRLENGARSFVLALYPEPFLPEELSYLTVHALLESYELPVPATVDVDGPRGIVLQEDLGRPHAAGRPEGRERGPPRGALPRGGGRDRPAADEGRAGPPEAGLLPDRVRHREAVLGAALLPEALPRGPPRLRPLGGGPRHALGGVPRAQPRDRLVAPRPVPPRLPQPQPDAARASGSTGSTSRTRAWGPSTYDLASLLRDAYVDVPEELQEDLQGALPADGDAGRAAGGLPPPLRPHVRAAQPEGPRDLRLHGDGARATRSTCSTSRATSPTRGTTCRATRSWSGSGARSSGTCRSSADGDRSP